MYNNILANIIITEINLFMHIYNTFFSNLPYKYSRVRFSIGLEVFKSQGKDFNWVRVANGQDIKVTKVQFYKVKKNVKKKKPLRRFVIKWLRCVIRYR